MVNERSAQRDAGLSQNHSFGTFYKYDRHPSGEYSSMFYTDSYENGLFKERSESNITQEDMFKKHIFNAYYNGKVGQLSIDLNIDGLYQPLHLPERQPVSQAHLHPQRCAEHRLQVDEPDAELRAHQGCPHHVHRALPGFYRPVHQSRAPDQQPGGLRPPDGHCFRTSRYRDLSVHNPARRTFLIDLTWKFNEARSKYRGSGAGEKQKARM